MERYDDTHEELIELGQATEVTKGVIGLQIDGQGGQQAGIDNE